MNPREVLTAAQEGIQMVEEHDDGGSAFPEVVTVQRGDSGDYWAEVKSEGGMSLRDYFAIHASAEDARAALEPGEEPFLERLCRARYALADAMLRARAGA